MDTKYQIKIIETESEIEQFREVAFLLRPHLNKETWSSMISEMMKSTALLVLWIMENV